jgi:hypothetical protein
MTVPRSPAHCCCWPWPWCSGFIVLGTAAERLSRRGISTLAVGATGMGLFMVVMAVIVGGHASGATVMWILFGFFGTSGILPYAALSQSFPLNLSGRVNTTLNLLVFLAAFCRPMGNRRHHRPMARHSNRRLCARGVSGGLRHASMHSVDHHPMVLACERAIKKRRIKRGNHMRAILVIVRLS